MIRPLILFSALAFGASYPTLGNLHYDEPIETVLDLIQPAPGALQGRPVVIVIHGSVPGAASKSDVMSYCTPFVDHGFVVANVEYRSVEDIAGALKWLYKHADRYKLDPKRMVVAGGSTAIKAALETDEPRWAALILFAFDNGPAPVVDKNGPPFLAVTDQAAADSWPAIFKWLKKRKIG